MPLSTRAFLGLLASSALSAATLSCVSTKTGSTTVPASTGDAGGTIYRTKCAKCHAPEPVRRYTAAHWNEILPKMTDKAKLTASEAAAVREYVQTYLDTGSPAIHR